MLEFEAPVVLILNDTALPSLFATRKAFGGWQRPGRSAADQQQGADEEAARPRSHRATAERLGEEYLQPIAQPASKRSRAAAHSTKCTIAAMNDFDALLYP